MSEKKPSSAPRGAEESNPAQSAAGCFRRLVWSIGGLGVLVILWIAILREPPWTFSQKDVLFWGAAATMIAARHLDVSRYDGRTMTGERATRRDVWRYALGLFGAASALWCVGHAFQV